MNKRRIIEILGPGLVLFFCLGVEAAAATRQAVVAGLAAQAGRMPNALQGERVWTRQGIEGRRCGSCHGRDLTRSGRHQRTRKPIAPMAPSVNPDRYTDPKKVAKWLRRNCKWTFGRDCTPGEKADLLQWLGNL